jgi:hypothetical protein
VKRLIASYNPDECPVKIINLICEFQPAKEGVYASVDFALAAPQTAEEGSGSDNHGSARIEDAEAVEFTFVLYDLFDTFLASRQGVAGPGKYPAKRKKHRAKWIFEFDGAFSQYHALCFPSQVRFLDGTIWRCNRDECIQWLNEQMHDAPVPVTEADIFADGGMREGSSG